MSTNIFGAWRIPVTDFGELVELGNTLKQLQTLDATEKALLDQLSCCPWAPTSAAKLKEFDPEFKLFPPLARVILEPLLAMRSTASTWVATAEDRRLIQWMIHENVFSLERFRPLRVLNKEEWALFEQFIIDVYETLAQDQNPSVIFIKGDNETTYVKSFSLSKPGREYMDAHYERFEYTDATNMEPESFSKEVQEKIAAAATKDEAMEIAYAAQSERGRLWDEALNSHPRYRDAGLKFSLDQNYPGLAVQHLFKRALEANAEGQKEEITNDKG